MKEIFVIERQDNFGEFQPHGNTWHHSKSKGVKHLETLQQTIPATNAPRMRIARYVRQSNE